MVGKWISNDLALARRTSVRHSSQGTIDEHWQVTASAWSLEPGDAR
jgi:hypothetical protein